MPDTHRRNDVDIQVNVERFLSERDLADRRFSYDYCYNYFRGFQSGEDFKTLQRLRTFSSLVCTSVFILPVGG